MFPEKAICNIVQQQTDPNSVESFREPLLHA
jgi:hypothetical protein